MSDITPDTVEEANTGKRPTYQKIAILAPIALTISGTLTGVMSYANRDISQSFLQQWGAAWGSAILIAMPIGMMSMILIGKLIQKKLSDATTQTQNIVTGVVMALIMETFMAITTTANQVGFDDFYTSSAAWSQNFSAALPFGLAITVLMTLLIKPKLEAFMKS